MHTLLYQAPNFSNFGGPYLQIGGRYPHALAAIRWGEVYAKNSIRWKKFVRAL